MIALIPASSKNDQHKHVGKVNERILWSAPFPTRQVAAAVPHGVRIYAVGDIHGRADLLSSALRGIRLDCRRRPADRPITVFVGDYIDRGPHSRAVLDLLLRWREDNEAVFIRGNHETFLPRFLADFKNSGCMAAKRWSGDPSILRAQADHQP